MTAWLLNLWRRLFPVPEPATPEPAPWRPFFNGCGARPRSGKRLRAWLHRRGDIRRLVALSFPGLPMSATLSPAEARDLGGRLAQAGIAAGKGEPYDSEAERAK